MKKKGRIGSDQQRSLLQVVGGRGCQWLVDGCVSGSSGGDGDGTSSDTSYGTMTQALVYQMTRRVCVYVFIRPLTRVH